MVLLPYASESSITHRQVFFTPTVGFASDELSHLENKVDESLEFCTD